MWFGAAPSHRGEGAAYKHAAAKHGPSQPAAEKKKKKKKKKKKTKKKKKKKKKVEQLKGQQKLMFRQPLPPPVEGTPDVGMPAVPAVPAVPAFGSNYGFRAISREEGKSRCGRTWSGASTICDIRKEYPALP
jgi:hypothetical protein